MRLTKGITRILGVVVTLSVAGCEDLNIPNPNAPDTQRALSDPATITSVVGGTWSTWFNAVQGDASLVLTDQADSYSASWNNFNMRIYATQPRVAWINDPAATQRVTIEWFWYALYSMLSSANDGLIAIRNRHIAMGDDSAMVETAALLGEGMALGWLALHYDSAFVVDETTPRDAQGAPIVTLQHRSAVRDAAILKINAAITEASANQFTFPAKWFGGTFEYDQDQVVQIAHSMAARILAYYPRSAAENAAVNWATVLSHAQLGISSGTPFDLTFSQTQGCVPPYAFCDELKLWGEDPTSVRVHTRVSRLLDPGTQDTPFALNNALTTVPAAITAGGPQAVTPASMSNIRLGSSVTLDPDTVSGITVTNAGVGYKGKPGVTIVGGHGAGAAATVVMAGDTTAGTGTVASVTLTKGGSGYTEAPTVRFSGGNAKTSAAATAAIHINPNQETVRVLSVTPTTFTATFVKSHAAGATLVRNGGSQGNPQPFSPDKRLGDGTYGSFGLAGSLDGVPSSGAGAGTDYMWSAKAIFRPERGSWFQSNIAHIRYFYAGFSDATGGGFGDIPQMLAAENDLLWAEALIRTGGDLNLAAAKINKTRVTRGGLSTATGGDADLLAKLQYEQDVELIGSGEVPYFNQRRIDGLEPLTPRQFPIPAKELGVLQKELYTYGGASNPSGFSASVSGTGPRVKNVVQIWNEMLQASASRARARHLQ